MNQKQDQEYAKRIISHYITNNMRAAGLQVDNDTYSEIGAAIDSIIEAAKAAALEALTEAPEIERLERRIDQIKAGQEIDGRLFDYDEPLH